MGARPKSSVIYLDEGKLFGWFNWRYNTARISIIFLKQFSPQSRKISSQPSAFLVEKLFRHKRENLTGYGLTMLFHVNRLCVP